MAEPQKLLSSRFLSALSGCCHQLRRLLASQERSQDGAPNRVSVTQDGRPISLAVGLDRPRTTHRCQPSPGTMTNGSAGKDTGKKCRVTSQQFSGSFPSSGLDGAMGTPGLLGGLEFFNEGHQRLRSHAATVSPLRMYSCSGRARNIK